MDGHLISRLVYVVECYIRYAVHNFDCPNELYFQYLQRSNG